MRDIKRNKKGKTEHLGEEFDKEIDDLLDAKAYIYSAKKKFPKRRL